MKQEGKRGKREIRSAAEPWKRVLRAAATGTVLTLVLLGVWAVFIASGVVAERWRGGYVGCACSIAAFIAGKIAVGKRNRAALVCGTVAGLGMAALFAVSGFLLYSEIVPSGVAEIGGICLLFGTIGSFSASGRQKRK